MDLFSILTLIGGLALFLYGMNAMGDGLAKVSGGKLEKILENLTSNPIKAVLLGAGVTAVNPGRRRHHSTDPVIFSYDCYGSRFCKFRDHEIITGSRSDHGCQYRYYDHLLDLKPDRNTE